MEIKNFSKLNTSFGDDRNSTSTQLETRKSGSVVMEDNNLKYNRPKNIYTAAIGFFDGVHLGHRFVIEQLKMLAENNNSLSLIVTFGVHPRKVLQSGFQPKLLTTLPEKICLLEKQGVDACTILDFTPEIARISAYNFMKEVLKEQYNIGTLLIGYDHRFGHKRQDKFPDYVRYGEMLGMQVVLSERFSDNRLGNVSSSEIREALQNGQIEKANSMLGYPYFFEGKVVDGFKVGRKIGFPTANLQLEDKDKLLPASGVYAVKVTIDGETLYPGMLNIGNRPTLANNNEMSVEVHIIGFDEDIYGQTIEVQFIRKIRDEKKFDDISKLIEQLEKDKKDVLNSMF